MEIRTACFAEKSAGAHFAPGEYFRLLKGAGLGRLFDVRRNGVPTLSALTGPICPHFFIPDRRARPVAAGGGSPRC